MRIEKEILGCSRVSPPRTSTLLWRCVRGGRTVGHHCFTCVFALQRDFVHEVGNKFSCFCVLSSLRHEVQFHVRQRTEGGWCWCYFPTRGCMRVVTYLGGIRVPFFCLTKFFQIFPFGKCLMCWQDINLNATVPFSLYHCRSIMLWFCFAWSSCCTRGTESTRQCTAVVILQGNTRP